jgi:hypothetical protein
LKISDLGNNYTPELPVEFVVVACDGGELVALLIGEDVDFRREPHPRHTRSLSPDSADAEDAAERPGHRYVPNRSPDHASGGVASMVCV